MVLGFRASELHPSVYRHRGKGMLVMVHMDDVLSVWAWRELQGLFDKSKKKSVRPQEAHVGLDQSGRGEALEHSFEELRATVACECDPKHARILETYSGMDNIRGKEPYDLAWASEVWVWGASVRGPRQQGQQRDSHHQLHGPG